MSERALRLVVPRYGPAVTGGSEELARRLATTLAQQQWAVGVWTTDARDEATWGGRLPVHEREASGVSVHRFPVAMRRRPRAFHQLSRVFFRLPPALRPESVWLRLQGPYAPGLVRALSKAPPAATLFSPYLYYPVLAGLPVAPHPRLLMPAGHDEGPLHLRAVAHAIEAADGLWYHTPEERELVEAVHPAARQRPNAIGTVGVEPREPGDAARFRHRLGIVGPMLVFGGRTTPGKGFDLLLEGFRRVRERRPDASLVVTGDATAAGGAGGVYRIGRIDDRDWADCLAAASAVVVASRLESLSLLALEAWAAGRPCLLNARSPVLAGQAARSGGALTFDGPQRFAAEALRLIDDPALAAGLGESGRRHVLAVYRWPDVVTRLEELIAEAELRLR